MVERFTLLWPGIQSPHAERLIVGILASAVCALYGATKARPTRRRSLAVLTCVAVGLNARYFLWTCADSIRFFIALYDPFIHVGLDSGGAKAFVDAALGRPVDANVSWAYDVDATPGLRPCLENYDCGLLPYYKQHPDWAGVFYSEFADSDDGSVEPEASRLTLRAHIAIQTLSLVLCFFQVFVLRPPAWKRAHKVCGYVAASAALVGSCLGLSMGLDDRGDDKFESYGAMKAVVGWASMFLVVMATLVPGINAARRKDFAAHEAWMLRFYGSMWGAFLAFRLLFIAAGRLCLRSRGTTALVAVWLGAPVGVGIAEWSRLRRRAEARPKAD